MKLFRKIERHPIYTLENPSLRQGMLRVSIVAQEDSIKALMDEIKKSGLPFKILRLSRPKIPQTLLDDLTARQRDVLRLAHMMGYYDVPKRVRVEDLARILGMNKGTVGEHLRRAERHLMDNAMK